MDILILLLCNLGYAIAVYDFCTNYLTITAVRRKIFIPVFFLGGILLNGLCMFPGVPSVVSHLLYYTLFTLFLSVICTEKLIPKLLASIILITLRLLVGNFAGSFLCILYLAGANFMTSGTITALNNTANNIIDGLTYLTTAATIIWLKKRLAAVFEPQMRNHHTLLIKLLLPLIVIVEIVNLGASNGILVVSNPHSGRYWGLFYDQIFSHAAVCLLTALSMCIAGGLVFGMSKLTMEQQKTEQYHLQIQFYKMLHEQYSQMERLRHDMKNHVLSLHGLWKGREWDKMGNYLESMAQNGNIDTSDEVTGNRAIDALLYHKKKQALQYGIRWEADVQFPQKCPINEFDLCVLFGNILDNAIRACTESDTHSERFVTITAQQMKHCLLIVARNSTKLQDQEKINTGIGLQNISETVRKYNGTFRYEVKNHVFEASVLLPFANNSF